MRLAILAACLVCPYPPLPDPVTATPDTAGGKARAGTSAARGRPPNNRAGRGQPARDGSCPPGRESDETESDPLPGANDQRTMNPLVRRPSAADCGLRGWNDVDALARRTGVQLP